MSRCGERKSERQRPKDGMDCGCCIKKGEPRFLKVVEVTKRDDGVSRRKKEIPHCFSHHLAKKEGEEETKKKNKKKNQKERFAVPQYAVYDTYHEVMNRLDISNSVADEYLYSRHHNPQQCAERLIQLVRKGIRGELFYAVTALHPSSIMDSNINQDVCWNIASSILKKEKQEDEREKKNEQEEKVRQREREQVEAAQVEQRKTYTQNVNRSWLLHDEPHDGMLLRITFRVKVGDKYLEFGLPCVLRHVLTLPYEPPQPAWQSDGNERTWTREEDEVQSRTFLIHSLVDEKTLPSWIQLQRTDSQTLHEWFVAHPTSLGLRPSPVQVDMFWFWDRIVPALMGSCFASLGFYSAPKTAKVLVDNTNSFGRWKLKGNGTFLNGEMGFMDRVEFVSSTWKHTVFTCSPSQSDVTIILTPRVTPNTTTTTTTSGGGGSTKKILVYW